MTENSDDDAPLPPFTKEQHRKILRMLESQERAAWFWASTGIWLKWIGSILAICVAFKVLLGDYIRGVIPR